MRKILSFLMMTLFASFAMADSYVKVTATPSDWEGDYLIVYEAENVAFNGGLATLDAASNTIAVEIADGAIAANETTNAAKFTLEAVEGGYSVKSASGKYIGVGSYGNGLKQADAVGSYVHNSMSIDADGNAIIAIYNETWNTTGGSMILNYNANKSDKRFRYYKGGSQKKIQLYKFTASSTPTHTYTVAGSSDVAFGTTWAPANTANDMVKQDNGTYKWEKTDLTLPAGAIEFKVCEDHDWEVSYPAQNYSLNIAEAGIYTITITFDPAAESDKVAAQASKTGSAEVDPTAAIKGGWDSWANELALVLAGDKLTATGVLNIAAAGDYEFKVILNGSDWRSNGYTYHRDFTGAEGITGNGDNMKLQADVAGEYTFTWTFATNALAITFPEQSIEVELQEVSDAISWDFSKLTANNESALYGSDGIKLTAESTPSKTDEIIYTQYANNLWTIGEGFDGASIAFTGEYPIRKNKYCQNGTLRFKTTVAGSIVVKFSDTGTSASATAVKRYLIVNGEQTEYWTSRENNGDDAYDAQLDVTTGAITVAAGEVTITGSSAIVVYSVEFAPASAPEPTKYFLKNNWDGAETWTWKEMTNDNGSYILAEVVFGGTGVNINTAESDEGASWIEAEDIEAYNLSYEPATLGALDTVVFIFDPEAVNTFTGESGLSALILGKYVAPVPEPTAKFYITGNAALVGDELAWQPNAIKSMEDSYTLSLKAGVDYMLKLTLNGTWVGENNVKGYDALTTVADGLKRGTGSDDDNICFKLAEDGDVTVTYKVEADVVTFKLEGNFYVDSTPVLADGFYLIGRIGGVDGWDASALKAENKFAPNLENPVEFMLNVTLAEGDEIQVVNVLNSAITAWFPGGEGNNFIVTAAYAGEKTVYFRPDNQGGEGWHHGCIYIAPNQGTGISNTAVDGKAVKMIMDGQLLIIRNGKTYNVQGQQVR